MLDSSLREQLVSVFGKLEKPVELIIDNSTHEDHKDLLEMLDDVAETSPNITVKESGNTSPVPAFQIAYQGKPTGISFKGIPGGHEFTSLILAILNTDGKGKLLDSLLVDRVRRLNKGITVQTFMSLTCENCPEVVQALNLITLAHGNMKHEVIDGGYVQDEVQKLGIQGVPSLAGNGKMFHSGRISVLDLIEKLEKTYGIDENASTEPSEPVNKNLGHFDVLVIGGGPAGASAAIYSVRKGLSTAMITEKIGGQVQETKGIENLIGVTYTEGPQLAAQLNQHVSSYPVRVLENRRVKSIKTEGKIKTIELESGEHLVADSIIVTTGAKWRELGVEGEKEYMGRGVAYCPHCDGPFYKGKKVAVIGGGNSGVEAAIDLAGIVREVVVIEYNNELKADRILVDKLKSLANVSVITGAKTEKVIGDGAKVHQLEYMDRESNKLEKLDLDGVFVQIGLVPNSQFLKGTVELTKFGEIITDEKCRTNVKGIYAAGDVTTTPYKQIVIAMGEGAKAALAAFEDRMYDHA